MYKHDNALIDRVDLPAALGLLTRLPIVVDSGRAMERGAAAAWAYPLVGVVVGVILAAATALMLAISIPTGIVAGLVLAGSVVMTGAMHEDGLADSADGLWGGWEKAHRLAIMKDSHIGVYGVCAIALSLLIRWLALVVIVSMGAYWVAFMTTGALSRASMVGVMAVLPNARDGGLSRTVGRPASGTVWLAAGIAIGFALLCGYPWAILIALISVLCCTLIARAKIGGQTGDILGATQQITEIAVLIAIVVTIT
ncbi:adenosylcobinamide-GDP ribazoletransferase [Roseobacter sp. CCS2]|uniref:adenosylcobinamide-GDP ribazoletransferase n=1 Tax=Roseobacter sp. CCS2 TaxID=391593 RepID=UPI0000F3E452|nr:adenosylcobinamide-GDP ribazoletransferase [Roseobacter sp. CCS2]EBA12744.1 putative Cobalamin (5'-phosphate) synthase [Roseobacter sp. CCS2]